MRPYTLMLAVLVLISCGKDKESEDPQPSSSLVSLVGVWTGVSQDSKITSGGKDFVQALTETSGDAAWAAQMNDISINAHNGADTMFFPLIEIKSDGTLDVGSTTIFGKWTLSDDKKTVTMSLDAPSIKKMTGTITKQTDADLWIEVNLSVTDPMGILIPYTFNSVLKFERKK